MKFSFILCTRNSERVLAEVVESIASQKIDHKLIEIILADYESSDQTIEIAKVISKKYQIKFNHIECSKPGKTPALEMALDLANGDYSVIVDDDNVLDGNYIVEAEKLLIDPNWGCLGSQGFVDKNLILPDWFNEYKGHYAIGVPLGAKDWVWGACCIINMIAWKKLRKKGFEMKLNPARISHSHPIEIGAEDMELSLATYMIGYKVKFVEQLKFIHKFEQKRLNQKYFLENAFGVCRSIPILEIYRLIIYKPNSLFPKIIWISGLSKTVIACAVKWVINILINNHFKAKYNYKIILGIISGYAFFNKNFYKIYNRLEQIKKTYL
jgi:glycosyltransferase involved in cell wall biosynthesis